MTTALEGSEGSASRPSRSLSPGKTRYPLYRRLGGPQDRSGQVRKISPPPGYDPRTIQPAASRYTDVTRPTSALKMHIYSVYRHTLLHITINYPDQQMQNIYIFVDLNNKLYKMHDTYIQIHQYMHYKLIRQRVSAYLSSHDQVLI